MSAQYDVLVVGGRVAGASTAMLLARAGARVALVERSAYGSDTVSTHGLMRTGVMQLSRWGLLDRLTGTPPIRCTTFHYSDREPEQVPIRALYAPRRHLLDRVLVDAAAEAGAEVRHGVAVTSLLRDDGGRVTGVRTRDGSELTAGITIGADGIRSTIASATGAPVVRRGRSRSAVLYRYYAGVESTGYEWAYAPGRGAGLLPTTDGATCVFVATTPARMRSLRRGGTEQAFTTLLADMAPSLTDLLSPATPVDRMHGWAGAAGFFRQAWGPGWALVGDAGYYKDPITTHGMTDALRDAELLSDALTGAGPESAALAKYQATRDELSTALFEVTESVASYAWSLDELRVLLRKVSSAMKAEVAQFAL
ncbi:NAD(P)/FAD-dependent oxidoreductase [Kribbella jiaozuonensis]|uniref:NAD(P)/FAD-dependent oxidoreductase n=1 Tax=Kribbella jiaozuonensis TaxID=2575441 RepID=A0A4U3M4Q0_9ACTN|nr:NAD(P)/FAD-dependent oxidoreductase [Kribbella jiaozuonensis]TKK82317.1 NAD(P)/FAD-dependent oxidoreductase [Kribbella jiaozuonensis]